MSGSFEEADIVYGIPQIFLHHLQGEQENAARDQVL